jgi:hypothetical protein
MFALRRLDWRSLFQQKMVGDSSVSIHRMVVNNNIVAVATTSGMILRMNLESGGDFEMIEVCQRPEDSIHEIFMDSTGYHLVVGLTNGTNYYVHGRSNKAKLLTKLQCVIESIAFNTRESTESTTKSILVGSSSGQILEVVIENGRERACQLVYQFEDSKAVTSIKFETYSGASGNASGAQENMFMVLCVCSPPTRLYYFRGGPTFQRLFSDYGKTSTYTELPGPNVGRPKLVDLPNHHQTTTQKFAVMCGVGIYQGTINSGRTTNDISEEAKLTPYPSSGTSTMMPISLASTQYHYLLLTEDGKRLMALSSLDGSMVQSYAINHAIGSNAFDFSKDPVKNSLWLHTSTEIFQITVVDEDRNVWQVYLAQALQGDETQFDAALMACPKEKRHIIYIARAEACLVRGDHEGAALSFSSTNLAFEDVVLRLVGAIDPYGKPYGDDSPMRREFQVTDSPNLSSVRIYIEEVLQILPADKRSQRTMLCTWACEIFLHQIASVGIRNLPSKWDAETDKIMGAISFDLTVGQNKARLQEVERELVASFGEFLRTHKSSIDKDTTLTLFKSRSRDLESINSLVLLFAQITGDYDLAVSELLSATDDNHVESRCLQAIDILTEARFERVEKLVYKYVKTLLELQPARTVQMLLHIPRLDVVKLLGAGLTVDAADGEWKDEPGEKAQHTLHYLKTVIQRANEMDSFLDEEVYHALVHMYCQYDDSDESELVAFFIPTVTKYHEAVSTMTGAADITESLDDDNFMDTLFSKDTRYSAAELVEVRNDTVPFDVNYVLRLCQQYHRQRSVIMLNLLMGRDIRALNDALALQGGKCLATFIIELPGSNRDRKERLITMAKDIISRGQTKVNPAAGVQDAIHLMRQSDGMLTVEDLLPFFPDSTEMDLFRDDMCTLLEKSSNSIKKLREEMTHLASTADTVSTELTAIKNRGLVMDNSQDCFYCRRSAFSAQFYLFPCGHAFHTDCVMENMEKHLDTQQLMEARKLQTTLRDIAHTTTYNDHRLQAQRDLLREQLDGYIACECPLCGDLMIKSIEQPLFERGTGEEKTWNISN